MTVTEARFYEAHHAGYTLIAHDGYEPEGGGSYASEIVLVKIDGRAMHPFVVWDLVMPAPATDRSAYCVHGDYHQTIGDAVRAYEDRVHVAHMRADRRASA